MCKREVKYSFSDVTVKFRIVILAVLVKFAP